ncbi:MAG TPA: potassium transporter TrkG [Acidobacteriota bacterium]|nr:potassium transporter TrkG [Acidobacteriota bacterium]
MIKRPFAATSGFLLACLPFPAALAVHEHGLAELAHPTWTLGLTAAATLGMLIAGIYLPRKIRPGRLALAASLAAVLGLLVPRLTQNPALALLLLLTSLAYLMRLWWPGQSRRLLLDRQPEHTARARGAAAGALTLWTLASLQIRLGTLELAALSLSMLIAAALLGEWLRVGSARHRRITAVVLAALGLAGLGAALWASSWWEILVAGALFLLISGAVLPLRWRSHIHQVDWWEPVLGHPERLLAVTFLVLCLAGTLLLALPAASSQPGSIGLTDAAFTAVSAVCVTGLIVLDTPHDFSAFGQAAILLLIQLGGLGIMSFSTLAIQLLGGRMSLRHEGAVAGLMSIQDRSRVFATTRLILLFTLAWEAAGTIGLLMAFLRHGENLGQALWRAVFTAVSAFCNSGFALQSDSLVGYQQDPWVLHIVGTLIVLGGLSPLAVLAIPHLLAGRRSRPVAVQSKLALLTSAVLLASGFLAILAIEWDQTLAHLSWSDRIHNAWFQSVTLRTAGFNSLDIAAVQPATVSLMLVWMFIGGSPGGTAGGIKTTTLAVLLLAVYSAVRGRWQVYAFARTVPHKTVYKAAAITTVALAGLVLAVVAMQLTQSIPTRQALFEVVSALGTVGLSLGATSMLDGVGKTIIIACMFIGRVGTLTLFMFLSRRLAESSWMRPEEEVDVG